MPNTKLRIGTNTKMYKTIAQTVQYVHELGQLTRDIDREKLDLFVIPSFTALERGSRAAEGTDILLGAQNMGWEDAGQFTGEISPLMLNEVGVRIVEIGHSERRHILHEDDEMVNLKMHAALRHQFTPLLCVGETLRQKNSGIADETIRTQLKLGLQDVSAEDMERVWIAYEPVWAIGEHGTPATPAYAGEIHRVIRRALAELFGAEAARAVPLLYGGSVDEKNACGFAGQPDIDGLFIGRSAWDASRFNTIIRSVLTMMPAGKHNAGA